MSEKTLSVFVDESGILNESDGASRYYIVSFVLHDQTFDVSDAISSLDRDLAAIGIVNLCFHAAPIIRGNGTFTILSAELRRKIFSRMMGFVRKVDFKYHCICIDKHYCDTTEIITSKLERQMHEFIVATKSITEGFSKVKVYYDCGQKFIRIVGTDPTKRLFFRRLAVEKGEKWRREGQTPPLSSPPTSL